MKTNIQLFAARSKKTGNFFKFKEYTDDGWGEYHASITKNDIEDGELPDMLSSPKLFIGKFFEHTPDEVEIVPFTVNFD